MTLRLGGEAGKLGRTTMAENGDRLGGAEEAAFSEPELPASRVPSRSGTATIAPDPEVGERVKDYELLALLGKGGAGSVFKARRVSDSSIVALKVLSASKVKRARIVQRFFDEVRAAGSVAHPGLIKVFDFIEEESPRRLAYAMEYVEGEVLRARIKREGALDLRTGIQIAIQICDALAALHDNNIIHRDLKPENILILDGPPGDVPKVKLLDFGVVKFLPVDRTGGVSSGTDEKPGTFVGTPRYMAPEQAAGATVDARADLFSIGVMLFEMITGRCPHEGDSLRDVVLAKLKGAPRITVNPEKEILPQELTDVVDSCLKLKPGLRPSRAGRVAAALRDADMVLFAVGPVRERAPSMARPVTPVSSERIVLPKNAPRPKGPSPARPPSTRPGSADAVAAAPTPKSVPIPKRAPAPAPTPVPERPAPVSSPQGISVAKDPEPKSRIVWMLLAVCVAAAIALAVVWRMREKQENPMLLVPVAPMETEHTDTSTMP